VSVGQVLEQRQKLIEVVEYFDEILAAAKPVAATPVLPTSNVGLQRPAAFYDHIRGDEGELFPRMTELQLQGIEETLACAAGKLPLGWCAYVLATEYHETAKRMQAVREGLDVSDAWRRKNLRYYPWYGRGEIQLTWEPNYLKASKRLNELGYDCDLIKHPDQTLDPEISTAIMIYGMLEGWFTGKKLRDYLPADPEKKHYVNARRIVNGTDRAELIAGYALVFEEALRLGNWR
jgi:putative chitinase